MNLKKRILAFLSSEEPTQEVVELAQEKLEDGTIIIADKMEEGEAIFIKSEEDGEENVKLPIGDYILEGGKSLKISEEGIIESIGEAKEEESKEEMMEEPKEEELKEEEKEEEYSEEVIEEEAPQVDAQVQELIVVIASLEERIARLEGGQELSREDEPKEGEVNLSSEEVEVKEEEEPKPIVHTPKEKSEKKASFYFGKR